MATRQEIERAFIRAQEAGDTRATEVLGTALRAAYERDKAAAQQEDPYLAYLRSMQPAEEEAGFFENIGTGFGAGFVGTAESASLGAATLLEEEEELRAREKIQSVADRFMPEGGDQDAISYKVASGLGSLAGFLVPAAAGVAASTLGAPAAVASGIGLLGAGALGVGAGAGEASERARAYGATEEERNMATLRGAAIGSLEILPLGRILRIPGVSELGKRIGGETIEEGGSRIRRAFATGGEEAAQEAAAGFLQNLNELGYNAEAELLNSGLIDEAIAGGGAGAILQAVVDTFTKGRIRAQERAKNAPGADLGEVDTEAEAAARAAAQEELGEEQLDMFPEEKVEAIQGMGEISDDELAQAQQYIQDNDLPLDGDTVRSVVAQLRTQTLDVAPEATAEAEQPVQRDLVDEIDEAETADINQMYAEGAASKVPTPDPELPIADQIEQARGTVNMLEEQAIEAETGSLEEAQLVAQAERARQNLAEIESRRPAKQEETPVNREEAELAENVRAIDDTRALEQQRTTAEGRAAILQETIDTSNATDFNVLARDFSARLAEAGYGNTRPTARELITARRALAVKAAEPAAPKLEPAVDEPANVAPIEAQIPERQAPQREPEQASLPGMGRKRQPAPAQAPAPEVAPEVTPEIVTAEMLDGFGVSPAAPVRKRVVGKDIAAPEVREALIKFANNPKVAQQTRQNVTRKLEGTPDAQLELFQPTRGKAKDAPRTATVEPTAAVTPERGASPEPADVPVGGRAPEPVRGRDTERPAAPDRQRVDEPKPDARAADARESTERDTLEAKPTEQPKKRTAATPVVSKEATARVRAAASKAKAKTPAKAAKKPAEAKPAAVKDADKPTPAAKKPAEAKPAAKKPAEAKPVAVKDANKPIPAKERGKAANEKRIAAAIRSQAKITKQFTNMAPKERATNEDKAKIAEATKRFGDRDDLGKAISAYLGRSQRVVDGLLLAVHDSVFKTPTFSIRKGTTYADVAQYAGMDMEAANEVLTWARENLSPEANKFIREQKALAIAEANRIRFGRKSAKILAADEAKNDAIAESEVDAAAEATIDELDRRTKLANDLFDVDMDADPDAGLDKILSEFGFDLTTDAVAASSIPLHPGVVAELEAGNLKAALELLGATNPNKMVQNAAKKLAGVAGTTKVEVVTGLKNDAGQSVAGLFDPKTNTVKIDAVEGRNTHALLHEVTHAAASATLANKSHPLTKQLNKLYNDVKDKLDTAYGSVNLDEFVSEAFSNPEFRQKLARINVESDKALQRFVNALRNFMRRLIGAPAKPATSALDKADALIDNILHPAPESRSAEQLPLLSSPFNTTALAEAIGKVQKDIRNLPEGSTRRNVAKGFFDLYNKVQGGYRWVINGLMDTLIVGQVAKKFGFGNLGIDLHEAIRKMRGAIEVADDAFRGKLQEVERWVSSVDAETFKALNEVIYSEEYGSTVYQVDPTLTKAQAEKKYKGQTDESGNLLMDVWNAQRADWNKLGPEGQRMYKLMQSTYQDMYAKLRDSVGEQIDDVLGKGTDAAVRMRKDVFEEMFGKGKMEIYFPLVRTGDFKLEYYDNGERIYRSFESKYDRDAAREAIEGQDGVSSVVVYNQGVGKDYVKNIPSNSFMGELLKVLEANKVDPSVQEQMVRMYVEALPETSFAKSLQRRKGVFGYEKNALESFRRKGYDMTRQTERLRGNARIRAIMADIDAVEEPTDAKKKDGFNAIKREMGERANFAVSGAKNKQLEGWAQLANQVAFVYTIGANTASAIVNLSQIPLFVMPMLIPTYGGKNVSSAIREASSIVMGAGVGETGKSKAVRLYRSGLDSYYKRNDDGSYTVRDDLDLSPELIKELKEIAPLVKEAKDQAQLGNSHLFDVLGLDEGSRAQRSGAVRRKLDQVTALSAVMFNSAERYNRQVTLLAIYKLEMAKLAESNPNMSLAERQQKAIDVSMHKTTEYNGGSHLETAPRLSQQHIGRIAFMYKSYGLRMYATMLNTAKIAIQRTYPGDSKEAIAARKEARQQLAGIHGTALFFSGMYGLPLYGAMEVFFNLFLQDEDEGEEDFNTVVRKAIGEGWFKGPLTEFTGLDIGSRMRLSGLLIQANRFNPDASPEETLVHHIGGPAWSVGSRIARGYDDISKGNVQRGVEQLLPAGLSNLYKGSFGRLMEDQAYATRRGDPIYDDLSAGELFGQTFGFAPTGYVLQQEINQRNKGIERVLNEKRTKLMKDYYIAIRFGNSGKARDVMLDIQEFNKRHPEYMLGPKSIVRSLKGHMRTSARMEGGVTINPKLRQAMQESNAEYERGFKFFRLEDDD